MVRADLVAYYGEEPDINDLEDAGWSCNECARKHLIVSDSECNFDDCMDNFLKSIGDVEELRWRIAEEKLRQL
jgi:hypothetical protein